MIILNSILVILFALGKHYRDEIAHHPNNSIFPKWNWYNDNRWKTKSWWLKIPFSMFLDGWHFMEFLVVGSFSVMTATSVVVVSELHWGFIPIIGLIVYVAIGLHHEINGGGRLFKG